MPNSLSFRALFKKREDGMSNKGNDHETVASTSRLSPREGSNNREEETNLRATDIVP